MKNVKSRTGLGQELVLQSPTRNMRIRQTCHIYKCRFWHIVLKFGLSRPIRICLHSCCCQNPPFHFCLHIQFRVTGLAMKGGEVGYILERLQVCCRQLFTTIHTHIHSNSWKWASLFLAKQIDFFLYNFCCCVSHLNAAQISRLRWIIVIVYSCNDPSALVINISLLPF